MSPMDPLEYSPTPHLVLITLFIIFPLIYLCGRFTSYLLWLAASAARLLLFSAIRWIYADEYVEEEVLADIAKERRAKATTTITETTTIRKTTRILPKRRHYMNGQIALKHPTVELTTPLENEEEDETTEFEEELKQEEQNNYRHSPTEDEDEALDSEKTSKPPLEVPTAAAAEVSTFSEGVDPSLPPEESDSGTEGHFDESYTIKTTSATDQTQLPDTVSTKSLHINNLDEFPPLGATV